MNKNLMHKELLDYIAPSVVEMAVKAEQGFANSDTLFEDVPELTPDKEF